MPKHLSQRRAERYRNFLKFFIIKYRPVCYFCREEIDWREFFPKFFGKEKDGLTIHHINENREDNSPENLTICHRSCHRRHHRLDQIETSVTGKKKRFNIKEIITIKILHKKEKVC